MKNLLFFLVLFFAASAAAQKAFVVDPNAVVRNVTGSFNAVKVSSAIRVYLTQGEDEAIAVSASEEKYRNGIKTEIENNQLHIYYSGEGLRFGRDAGATVYVSFKNLQQLSISGASSVIIADHIDGPVLNVQLSGASNLAGTLHNSSCNIKLSGASDVKLKGTIDLLNLESSGASDLKAYDLVVQDCNLRLSGASDVDITVTKTFSVNASGASSIHYKGNPAFKTKQINGASSITGVDENNP